MSFRSGGIMSGLDTNTLIQQLVSIERQPIVNLQTRQSDYQMQISKFGELSSKLSDLKTALEAIDSRKELLALTASSSEEKIVRVTATGDASPGSYDVTVAQLAKAEKNRGQAFTAATDEVKAGTLTLTVKDDDPVDIAITEGMTLQDVANEINASDAAVSASIVNDGTSSYLFLTGLETGHTVGGAADDAIVISESYTGGTGTELSLTQTQQAQNALFNVDGLAIEKETNAVTDVVQGLTLELVGKTDATTPSVALSLVPDVDTVKDRFQGFVNAYNSVMDFVQRESSVAEGGKRSTKLAGDPVLFRVQSQLQMIVADVVSGATSDYDSLAAIGIKTASSGKLSLNAADLTKALNTDFLGVAGVMTGEDTGVAARMVAALDVFTDAREGAIKLRKDGLERSVKSIDDQIAVAQRRVDAYETSLVRQFTALETMMSQTQMQGNYLTATLG